MQVSLMVLSSLLLAAASPATPASTTVTLQPCLVSPLKEGEAQVPAEEAGVVVELGVVEGQQVKAGELLARIDDVEVQLMANVARLKVDVANEEAASSAVNVAYTTAASKVAENEFRQGLDANKLNPKTFSDAEVLRLQLTWHRSLLEIKKAESDQKVAMMKAKVTAGEADVAAEAVRRRQVLSPLDGQVAELRCHPGEWVKPGDPVVYVVRMDRLRIEGLLSTVVVGPGEVDKRQVAATVQLERGHKESFSGEVVFVSPLVVAGGKYRIKVEVENRQQNGHWLLRPGHTAEMTIQLK
jgi:macrolide-specific efflux system membrane fusion protein